MKVIKLTVCKWDVPVYVMTNKCLALRTVRSPLNGNSSNDFFSDIEPSYSNRERDKKLDFPCTCITLVGNNYLYVKETPEEIVALINQAEEK